MPVRYGETTPDQQTLKPHEVLPPGEFRRRKRFTMLVHPDRWEWAPEIARWVPEIKKFRHDPGVQGVGTVGSSNQVDVGAARAYHRERGCMDLGDGDPRLQGCPVLERGKYMVRFRVRIREGLTWCYGWVWEAYEMLGDEVHWEELTPIKRAVQVYIVQSGILPPMTDRHKKAQIKHLQRRVRRLATRHSVSPSVNLKTRLTLAETTLQAWRDNLEQGHDLEGIEIAEDGVHPPKPKKKTSKKGAKR